MDVAAYLQRFESSVSLYTGDDPLEQWEKFVELLEKKLPSDSGSQLSVVFNRLVETFLNVEKYANDERYVNYCIRCARFYPDPIALYSHLFSKGVGTRSTALYVSWAQQFEQRGMNEQAEAVYQKALENQAQPADSVLHEYREFQSRTKRHIAAPAGGRHPLQNSHSANVMSTQREPSTQNKDSADCQPVKSAERKYVIMVSRSETSGKIPPSSNANTVAAYDKAALECEGSELCFEEVRAQRYFQKQQQKQQQEQKQQEEEEESPDSTSLSVEDTQFRVDELLKLKMGLGTLNEGLASLGLNIPTQTFEKLSVTEAAPSAVPDFVTHQPVVHPRPSSNHLSSRRSLGLRLHSEPTFITDALVAPEPEPEPRMDAMPPAAGVSQHASVPAASVSQHASVLDESGKHMEEPEPVNPELDKLQHESELSQFKLLQQEMTPDYCPAVNDRKHNEESLEPELEEKLNVSQGGTANLSRITPNNSLGYIQATPSRVLPSPTVNTREALDVIMDMFQAPTLLEGPFPNTSADGDFNVIYTRNGPTTAVQPPTSAPFTIFQDDENENKENPSAPPAAGEMLKPIRALAEITVSKSTKPNETPTELTSDESTMWGARYNAQNSLAACPNSTSDFAMLAQFVSTPFTHKTPISNSFFPDQENGEGAEEEAFVRRQTKKLSPIIEQSPSEEKLNETAVAQLRPQAQQGTIVGEGLAMSTQFMATSCTTMVQPPPPAVLSFRDQTLCPANTSVHRSTGPGWEVYTSPEPKPKSEPFTILEDMEEPQPSSEPNPQPQDVPMSPESASRPDWLTIRSPEIAAERDLDAFLTPNRPESQRMSRISQDVPMSPQVDFNTDAHMMSPEKDTRGGLDVSMNPKTPRTPHTAPAMSLVSDPWNDELIAHFLANMDPPLTAHPRCVMWQCNLPDISPRMTLSMGNASLRVDCVLGEGAFAKVYQATDPMTSEKMVLKVQKPANPWEFYINTQLDVRVPPSMRHFYSSLHSAHLFINGSVLLGELHSYGTLLNAVNIYRTLGDKVMPQPLVMYFTVCILHMIEQLHGVGIVHADVKPDNFLLGERFLENRGFDRENLNHGLVLIDLGQSIDMRLFPEGTAFTAKCLTSGFQCTEMQTGKPWNYQTDYFGVAGTVYCLLFGTYMQVVNDRGVWKTNGVFRRNPHSDLWQEFFHTLLNVPDCSSLPDLRSLRHKLTSVLEQNYSNKLSSLKSRLVVLLLENSKKVVRR